MRVIKILMIDDEKMFCDLVRMNLDLSGKFEIYTANDGKEGVKAAKKLLPDLILLDIIMPKQDGFETLAILKEDPKTMSIPIIMLSALNDEKSAEKASSMYSQYYVTKPISTAKLIEKIEQVLGLSR